MVLGRYCKDNEIIKWYVVRRAKDCGGRSIGQWRIENTVTAVRVNNVLRRFCSYFQVGVIFHYKKSYSILLDSPF